MSAFYIVNPASVKTFFWISSISVISGKSTFTSSRTAGAGAGGGSQPANQRVSERQPKRCVPSPLTQRTPKPRGDLRRARECASVLDCGGWRGMGLTPLLPTRAPPHFKTWRKFAACFVARERLGVRWLEGNGADTAFAQADTRKAELRAWVCGNALLLA